MLRASVKSVLISILPGCPTGAVSNCDWTRMLL
jgi:hypothetical protein